jgi:hypothetical protein
MAIGATTVWRVRVGGNDQNGAAFDAAIAGAGTDYSQQDAAQLALTDLATPGAASTTLTSATGGFTAAMIGNGIRIRSGTNFTVGVYFITAYTDTNTVTLDRTPSAAGAGASGAGNVGGAVATLKKILDQATATSGERPVPGNIVYIRGSGIDRPTSADYTQSGHSVMNSLASAVNGRVFVIGENGRPRIECNGLLFHEAHNFWFENLYLAATGGTNLGLGLVNGNATTYINNIFDLANQNGSCISARAGAHVLFNEMFSHETAPTSNANAHGVLFNGNYTAVVKWNHIHHMGANGIHTASPGSVVVEENLIHDCKDNGIRISTIRTDMSSSIHANTIDANEGHGIYVDASAGMLTLSILNNNITNHVGSGKAGISVAGTLAVNDRLKHLCDHNNLYNNATDYDGISAGANDTALDPGYSSGHQIGTNLKALAYPAAALLGSTSRSFMDVGAFQREEASGGGATHVFRRRVIRPHVNRVARHFSRALIYAPHVTDVRVHVKRPRRVAIVAQATRTRDKHVVQSSTVQLTPIITRRSYHR